MKFFNGKSLFDLFVENDKKENYLNSLRGSLNVFTKFLLFLLLFSFIPILFFIKAKDVSTKYLLNFDEDYIGTVEFVETAKLGSTGNVIPGAADLISLGNSMGGESNGENDVISRIIKSDEVMQKALFSQTELNSNLVINEAVSYLFPESDIVFEKPDGPINVELLPKEQRVLFKNVRSVIEDIESDFYFYIPGETKYVQIKSSNENLSLSFPKALYDALEDFYEVRKVTDKKLLRSLIQDKKNESLANIRTLQNQITENRKKSGLTISPARANYIRELQGKLMIAQQMYAETTKQLEEVKILSEKNSEPHFRLLSKPIAPLSIVTPDNDMTLLIHQIIGAILGLFLVVFLYLIFQLILFYRNK